MNRIEYLKNLKVGDQVIIEFSNGRVTEERVLKITPKGNKITTTNYNKFNSQGFSIGRFPCFLKTLSVKN
jgi:hypothetical protein